jgi:hypothetical protein
MHPRAQISGHHPEVEIIPFTVRKTHRCGLLLLIVALDRYLSMAANRGEDAPVHQDLSPGGDAYAAGRDLHAHQVQIPVFGASGVQAGEHNTQVNKYFVGVDADLRRVVGTLAGAPVGRLLAEVTDPFALEVHRPVRADHPQPGRVAEGGLVAALFISSTLDARAKRRQTLKSSPAGYLLGLQNRLTPKGAVERLRQTMRRASQPPALP